MNYWTKETEDIIILYQQTKNNDARNKIYTEQLLKPLTKLVRGLLYSRRYAAIENKEELEMLCQSHVYLQLDKFNAENGTKSYSYFGTIVNNYISQQVWSQKKKFIDYLEIYNSNEIDESEEELDNFNAKEDMLKRLNNALHILDPHERIIYDLYFIQSINMSQIAKQIGVSSTSIFSIVRKIRIKLKKELGATPKLHNLRTNRRPTIRQFVKVLDNLLTENEK